MGCSHPSLPPSILSFSRPSVGVSMTDAMLEILGNILPYSTAAPSLQEKQRELAKHMRADSLEQKIQQRPKAEELVKEGILDEDPTEGVKG